MVSRVIVNPDDRKVVLDKSIDRERPYYQKFTDDADTCSLEEAAYFSRDSVPRVLQESAIFGTSGTMITGQSLKDSLNRDEATENMPSLDNTNNRNRM